MITFSGEAAVIDFEIVVAVPWLAVAVPDLDEADAAFDKSASDEHLAALDAVAIHGADGGGFFGEIESVIGFHLHAVSEFERLDAGFELGVVLAAFEVALVEGEEEVKLLALFACRHRGVADIFDEFFEVGIFGVQVGALVSAR